MSTTLSIDHAIWPNVENGKRIKSFKMQLLSRVFFDCAGFSAASATDDNLLQPCSAFFLVGISNLINQSGPFH